MKFFLKDAALAIAIQTALAGVTLLLFYLLQLPNDTWVLQWLRIYTPTILLVMILFMLFTKTRNLILALGLGFLLGAFLYGAIFSFILNLYRKHQASDQISQL